MDIFQKMLFLSKLENLAKNSSLFQLSIFILAFISFLGLFWVIYQNMKKDKTVSEPMLDNVRSLVFILVLLTSFSLSSSVMQTDLSYSLVPYKVQDLQFVIKFDKGSNSPIPRLEVYHQNGKIKVIHSCGSLSIWKCVELVQDHPELFNNEQIHLDTKDLNSILGTSI